MQKSYLAGMREKCPNSEFFWPVFSGIRTEYGEIPEKYFVSLGIISKCGKMRTRKAPNMDTFHAMLIVDQKLKKDLQAVES